MKSLLVFLVAVIALSAGQAPGYSFPTRYQALVTGWVNDYLIDFQTAYVTGYLFADYSTGSIRVDEVWNITSIMGTDFGDLGLSYDTHIQYAGSCYFYYYNASGVWCSPSPDSLFPQKIFPASSFVNVTEYEGQQCYYYEVEDEYGLTSGYINTVTNTPVAILQNWNVPGIGVIKTLQTFLTFNDLSADDSDFPANLFAIPAFCAPSNDIPKTRSPAIGMSIPRVVGHVNNNLNIKGETANIQLKGKSFHVRFSDEIENQFPCYFDKEKKLEVGWYYQEGDQVRTSSDSTDLYPFHNGPCIASELTEYDINNTQIDVSGPKIRVYSNLLPRLERYRGGLLEDGGSRLVTYLRNIRHYMTLSYNTNIMQVEEPSLIRVTLISALPITSNAVLLNPANSKNDASVVNSWCSKNTFPRSFPKASGFSEHNVCTFLHMMYPKQNDYTLKITRSEPPYEQAGSCDYALLRIDIEPATSISKRLGLYSSLAGTYPKSQRNSTVRLPPKEITVGESGYKLNSSFSLTTQHLLDHSQDIPVLHQYGVQPDHHKVFLYPISVQVMPIESYQYYEITCNLQFEFMPIHIDLHLLNYNNGSTTTRSTTIYHMVSDLDLNGTVIEKPVESTVKYRLHDNRMEAGEYQLVLEIPVLPGDPYHTLSNTFDFNLTIDIKPIEKYKGMRFDVISDKHKRNITMGDLTLHLASVQIIPFTESYNHYGMCDFCAQVSITKTVEKPIPLLELSKQAKFSLIPGQTIVFPPVNVNFNPSVYSIKFLGIQQSNQSSESIAYFECEQKSVHHIGQYSSNVGTMVVTHRELGWNGSDLTNEDYSTMYSRYKPGQVIHVSQGFVMPIGLQLISNQQVISCVLLPWPEHQKSDLGIQLFRHQFVATTSLQVATFQQNPEIAELLLSLHPSERPSSMENPTLLHPLEPLQYAITDGSYEMVKTFLNRGFQIEQEDMRTAVKLSGDRSDIVSLILRRFPQSGREILEDGNTPLHYAVIENLNVTKLLVGHGADLNLPNNCGHTPFHIAAAFGTEAIIWYLVQQDSVDRSVVDSAGWTSLHLAAYFQKSHPQWLVQLNTTQKQVQDEKGRAPIHVAASVCLEPHLTALTENMTNPRDLAGNTALHYAIANLRRNTVSTMAWYWGVNATNNNGKTLLITLLDEEEKKALSIENDPKVAASLQCLKHFSQKEPYQLNSTEIEQVELDLVKELIQRKIDLNAKDSSGKTAIDYAIQYKKQKVVNMLLDQGVTIPQNLEGKEDAQTQYQYHKNTVSQWTHDEVIHWMDSVQINANIRLNWHHDGKALVQLDENNFRFSVHEYDKSQFFLKLKQLKEKEYLTQKERLEKFIPLLDKEEVVKVVMEGLAGKNSEKWVAVLAESFPIERTLQQESEMKPKHSAKEEL